MVKKGILFFAICLSMVFGVTEVKAAGAVTYNGKVTYGPSTVGDFTANGTQAFCIEHVKSTPPTGTGFTEQLNADANIKKVLYYGWTGPAQWGGFENASHGIVATSIVLSHYYSGSSVSVESRTFYEWLQTQSPVPDASMSLSKPNVEAYLTADKSQQRTEEITLRADADNYITMSLPDGVRLYNVTRGNSFTGSARIYGGDTIYLTAPLEQDGTWSSGAMSGQVRKYQPVVCVTDSSLQNLSYGQWTKGPGNVVELKVKWVPHGRITICKKDAESGENKAQGNASLEGAVYEIRNTEGVVKETLTTDSEGKSVSGLLPYDTYMIGETAAPEGYLVQEDMECVLNQETVEVVSYEQIIRTHFRGVKIGGGSHKRLADVPFKVTSVTTGESHTVVTDTNGEFSSDGIWFGAGGADSGRGSLLYDTYTIEEQHCEANEGYELIPPFEISVYRNGQIIHLGTLTDTVPKEPEELLKREEEPEELPEKPLISTIADDTEPKGVQTGDHANLIVLILLLILSCTVMIVCGTMNAWRRIRRV